jgi:hypothetical protein
LRAHVGRECAIGGKRGKKMGLGWIRRRKVLTLLPPPIRPPTASAPHRFRAN